MKYSFFWPGYFWRLVKEERHEEVPRLWFSEARKVRGKADYRIEFRVLTGARKSGGRSMLGLLRARRES